MKCLWMTVPFALGAAACADDLDHDHDNPEPGGAHVTHAENGDGSTTTQVDASSETDWVYLDVDSKAEVTAAEASWDVAFRRTKIMVDGGVSGGGGVEIAIAPDGDFGAMAAAPADGYFTDAADGDDADADPDLAFAREEGWYSYDPMTHVITPRERIYVVRSTDGAYVKVQLNDYYDDAGTSGFPTFQWAPIDPPAR